MNLDAAGIERFFSQLSLSEDELTSVNMVVCPSFLFLDKVKKLVKDKKISVGAQNIFSEDKGAFTGEVSAQQLASMDLEYVIVGHSERRRIFSESDEMVNAKVRLALRNKIRPILCLGETYQQKEDGLTKKVIEQKVRAGLEEVLLYDMRKVIIAYEPIWAISTDPSNINSVPESPEEMQVLHKYIRRIIQEIYDEKISNAIPIIYGGSVNPDNIGGYALMDDIDGVLVGGASNEAEKFEKIIKAYL